MGRTLVWRSLAAAAFAGVLGAFPYLMGREVPLLDLFDLGIHELGHMITVIVGGTFHVLAGSLAQVLVPLALAAYFWLRDEMAGTAVCLAWTGTSMYDVSVYIADAPYQALPLIGGGHDWAYLLGPQVWDAIDSAHRIARTVSVTGAVLVVVGMFAALWPLAQGWRSEQAMPRPPTVRRPRSAPQAFDATATGSRHSSVATSAMATSSTKVDDPT